MKITELKHCKKDAEKKDKDQIDYIFSELFKITNSNELEFKSTGELNRIKQTWIKTFYYIHERTHARINTEKGLNVSVSKKNRRFPTVDEFIIRCDDIVISQLNIEIEQAYNRFIEDKDATCNYERITLKQCGYRAKRLAPNKRKKLFYKTYRAIAYNNDSRINYRIKTGQIDITLSSISKVDVKKWMGRIKAKF